MEVQVEVLVSLQRLPKGGLDISYLKENYSLKKGGQYMICSTSRSSSSHASYASSIC